MTTQVTDSIGQAAWSYRTMTNHWSYRTKFLFAPIEPHDYSQNDIAYSKLA